MTAIELVQQTSHTKQEKSTFVKLLEAYQKMDYHAINDLLDAAAYFEDMPKKHFIDRQKDIFQELKTHGDTHLLLSTTMCTGCPRNKPLMVFTGNHSGLKYAIYIEFTQGEITDIYRCEQQSSYFECIPPF